MIPEVYDYTNPVAPLLRQSKTSNCQTMITFQKFLYKVTPSITQDNASTLPPAMKIVLCLPSSFTSS